MPATAPEKKFNIADLVEGTYYPFEKVFTSPPCSGLTITYREFPDTLLEDLIGAAGDDLEALEFEPLPAVVAMTGGELTGEDGARYKERSDALTTAQRIRLASVLRRVQGAAVAAVVGSWNDEAPIDAETCAALPAPVQAEILTLAANQTMTQEQRDSLGKQPAS